MSFDRYSKIFGCEFATDSYVQNHGEQLRKNSERKKSHRVSNNVRAHAKTSNVQNDSCINQHTEILQVMKRGTIQPTIRYTV